MSSQISNELSVGEVIRTKADAWLTWGDTVAFTTEPLKGNKLLIIAEAGFSGMVGEAIVCYSYAILDLVTLETKVIASIDEYKKLVYPNQFKKGRIASWIAIKSHELFGWSEDPRPYVR